jgi:hypothetical protein
VIIEFGGTKDSAKKAAASRTEEYSTGGIFYSILAYTKLLDSILFFSTMAKTIARLGSFTLFFRILILFSTMNEPFFNDIKGRANVTTIFWICLLIVLNRQISIVITSPITQQIFLDLLNFIKSFEYTVDLQGKQIFPNNKIKQSIVRG